jgi:hypothetical protein
MASGGSGDGGAGGIGTLLLLNLFKDRLAAPAGENGSGAAGNGSKPALKG